ncbi:aspartate/glutamate racemase family protein [Faecalicatena contorta]|uniref:aspartate/glutamate racemase family protein n=1 Tax=Faecalicatena contorta TaxID=39482 RepID=UPI0031D3FF2D
MKTIGLIGGMSWESTVPYYQIINNEVKKRIGGLHSAKVILYSVEFDEIEKCQSNGDWEKSGDILGDAAQGLEAAGADFILICTNTMHKVAPQIQSMIHIPIIHIADATAQELEKCQIRRVGLLGTKYTMTQEFYKQRLIDRGIEVMIPDLEDIDAVNDIIFHELCIGKIREESRKKFQNIIDSLKDKGADGVILGCTEIGLLIHQADSSLPVFDTTMIHAKRAVEIALNS